MKLSIFMGNWYEAADRFNEWAEGKILTRDILIHEHLYTNPDSPLEPKLMIFVYMPEYKDKTDEPKGIMVPIHTKPETHIHAEEIVVPT